MLVCKRLFGRAPALANNRFRHGLTHSDAVFHDVPLRLIPPPPADSGSG